MTLQQGDRLGRYSILAPLGAGGMGEVYRARDTELEREVAVKVLPDDVADNANRLERFNREARAVAALSHPNILGIFDIGSENGIQYVVTELLEGDTLGGRVSASGLPWQKVVEFGAAIADGLAAAHSKGIIHRDLKPDNIFVTTDGRIKVLDFGLAKIQEEVLSESATATLTPAGTQAGTILGTMGYMAPEQVKGQATDGRSDIFALGCVLYEMASGKQAFGADTGVEMMAAILKEEPPRISSAGSALPTDLEHVINRCLEKDPEARFQSAADLAYNLRSIGTAAVPVMTGSPGEERSIDGRRRRWAMAAAVSLAAVAAIAIFSLQQMRPTKERFSAVEPVVDQTAVPFVNEWVVAVEPFQNRTGDPNLDSTGAIISDQLVNDLGRLTQGLRTMPQLTVAAAERNQSYEFRTAEPPRATRRRLLVSGSYTIHESKLDVIAQITDLDEHRTLFVSDPIQLPPAPRTDAMRPLVQKTMGAIGLHISRGIEHDSHVPDYEVFRENLLGQESSWSGAGDTAEERIEAALAADPEFLRPAFLMAGRMLWRGDRDGAAPYLDHIGIRSHRLTDFETLELELLEAWRDGHPGRALRAARSLQGIAPTDIHVRFQRAKFAKDLNRPGEVAATLADVVDRVPRTLVWYRAYLQNELLKAYQRLGDHEHVLAMAQEIRRDAPASSRAFWIESSALAGLGQLDELDHLVEECRRMPGGECEVASVLASSSLHLAAYGHHDMGTKYAQEAVGLYQAMTDDKRQSHETLYMLALHRAEEWDEYLAVATGGLDRSESGSDAHAYYRSRIGIAAARSGDRATAEAVLEELEVQEYLTYAAYVAGFLGELGRALEMLQRDIQQRGGGVYGGIVRWDPDLEPLWDYEPFVEMVEPKG